MEIAKALILAGRTPHDQPWPSVRSGPKHLVPVANQPILFHNLEALRRAGLLEATIAIEPESARAIMAAVGDGSAWHLTVRYVRWQPRSGVTARSPPRASCSRTSRCWSSRPTRCTASCCTRTSPRSRMRTSTRWLCGCPARRAREQVTPVAGAYLLSERAVSMLVDDRRASADPWPACESTAATCACKTATAASPATAVRTACSRATGACSRSLRSDVGEAYPVVRVPGAGLHASDARNSTTRSCAVRAVIGPGARLSHAYVGPYTSIGANVTVDGSQVEHSIVLAGAELMQHRPPRRDERDRP